MLDIVAEIAKNHSSYFAWDIFTQFCRIKKREDALKVLDAIKSWNSELRVLTLIKDINNRAAEAISLKPKEKQKKNKIIKSKPNQKVDNIVKSKVKYHADDNEKEPVDTSWKATDDIIDSLTFEELEAELIRDWLIIASPTKHEKQVENSSGQQTETTHLNISQKPVSTGLEEPLQSAIKRRGRPKGSFNKKVASPNVQDSMQSTEGENEQSINTKPTEELLQKTDTKGPYTASSANVLPSSPIKNQDEEITKNLESKIQFSEKKMCSLSGNIFIIFGNFWYKDVKWWHVNIWWGYVNVEQKPITENIEKLLNWGYSDVSIRISPIAALRMFLEWRLPWKEIVRRKIESWEVIIPNIRFNTSNWERFLDVTISMKSQMVEVINNSTKETTTYNPVERTYFEVAKSSKSNSKEVTSKNPRRISDKWISPKISTSTVSDVRSSIASIMNREVNILWLKCKISWEKFLINDWSWVQEVTIKWAFWILQSNLNAKISAVSAANIIDIRISPRFAADMFFEGKISDYYLKAIGNPVEGAVTLSKMLFQTMYDGLLKMDVIIEESYKDDFEIRIKTLSKPKKDNFKEDVADEPRSSRMWAEDDEEDEIRKLLTDKNIIELIRLYVDWCWKCKTKSLKFREEVIFWGKSMNLYCKSCWFRSPEFVLIKNIDSTYWRLDTELVKPDFAKLRKQVEEGIDEDEQW